MKKFLKHKNCVIMLLLLLCISGTSCASREPLKVSDGTASISSSPSSPSSPASTAESMETADNSKETEATNKEEMTQAAEDKEIVDEGFSNDEHNIYMGTIGGIEVRMRITRTDNMLSAAYITRTDEENDFTGKIENNSVNFSLYASDDDFLKGKIKKNGEGFISIEGQGQIDGKSVDFTLRPETFFSIGDNADNYYSELGYSSKEAEQFARKIKDTVNDKEAFTKIISYPISVDLDGRRIVIKNQEEMLGRYEKLMAQNDFEKQVKQIFTKYMFANYQGICIESGIIWCNKDSAGDYKITAINTHA